MSEEKTILAISRQTQHDQGHVSNDAAMFEMVSIKLKEIGYRVDHIDEDNVAEYLASSQPKKVISMAQRPENTALLAQLEADGVMIVNSFHAVLNTYRVFMALRLADESVPFAETRILSSLVEDDLENFEEEAYQLLNETFGTTFWLKRGDIHAAHPQDVTFITSQETFSTAIESFRERGVQAAIAQKHCEGEVIKFYAVAGGKFFHAQNFVTGETVDIGTTTVQEEAERIAGILGITIYGGDVVISPDGSFLFIDINAWPSFGTVREQAVPAMVQAIVESFEEERVIVDSMG